MLHLPKYHLSTFEVWLAAIKLWKISFKRVLPFAILFSLLAFLPYFFFSALDPVAPFATELQTFEEIILFVIYTLLIILIGAIVYYCIYHKIIGTHWSYHKVITTSLRKLPALFIAILIYALAVFFGYALLIIPGIFFSVALTLYYPLMILDDLSPGAAFNESLNLVRGHWWQTAVIVSGPFLLFCLLTFIIEYFTVGIGSYPSDLSLTTWYVNVIAKMVVVVFYFPFYIGIVLVQFYNLKLTQQQAEVAAANAASE